MFRFKQILLGWLAIILISGVVFSENIQNQPVRCIGRIDKSDEGNPVLYWPGSAIEATFEGSSLSVILHDQKGEAYYDAIIDRADDSPVVIKMEKGTHTYLIATNITDATHDVQLFRRTEGLDGATEFVGFVLDKGAKLDDPPDALKRKIEFYGDSITCGMGDEAPDDGPDNINSQRNNYVAYGAITARNLDAEYRCIARSGIGIVKSWFDLTMPDYWDRLNPNDPESEWTFDDWLPNVVVVNLFQNDSWLVPKMNPVPTPDLIIQAYIDFISGIRDVYPEAHIVCALGCMDATKEGSPWPGYIHQAVVQLEDPNISECIFPFTGWSKHPRVRQHQVMAEQLTAHIRKVMKWE